MCSNFPFSHRNFHRCCVFFLSHHFFNFNSIHPYILFICHFIREKHLLNTIWRRSSNGMLFISQYMMKMKVLLLPLERANRYEDNKIEKFIIKRHWHILLEVEILSLKHLKNCHGNVKCVSKFSVIHVWVSEFECVLVMISSFHLHLDGNGIQNDAFRW